MFFIITTQTQFRLQGYCVSKSSFHAFLNGVAGRIDEIIKKLKDENVSGIGNREIFLKHTEQSFNISFIRSCFQLEEFFERLNLDVEQVRGVC